MMTRLEQQRLRYELEMCRRIQHELLPRSASVFPLADVRGVCVPAREVGGDFFDYFVLSDADVAILIGDVSGNGLPAALVRASVQATLRARVPHERDLARLAYSLDRQIESTTPGETYVTLFLGILDTNQHELRYINAGHNTQYVVREARCLERLESGGRPLGLLPGGRYCERRIGISTGDALFLYTDGLVETEDGVGESFGTERLERLLLGEHGAGADEMLARIKREIDRHRGWAEPHDDVTMLVLRPGRGCRPPYSRSS